MVLKLGKRLKFYCADFETNVSRETIEKNPVWAWGICEINSDDVQTGTSIETFFEFISQMKNNSIIYFHNLGFDGCFIIDFALRNGMQAVEKLTNESRNKQFSCLRNKGKLYQIEFLFSNAKVKFWDSYKKLPMSIKAMPKAFNFDMEIEKGEIDYNLYRSPQHVLTNEEKKYLENDVLIDCKATSAAHGLGVNVNKMTLGSNAYADWQNRFVERFGENVFNKCFMEYTPTEWQLAHEAYRGGICTVNPKIKGKLLLKGGRVYDVNSMYPSVMLNCALPFGRGKQFDGKPEENNKLWIASFKAEFKLKKNAIAVFRPKHYIHKWRQGEYMENSGEVIQVVLTSVDFETFQKHYDIDIKEWQGGFYYNSCVGMFEDYINYWGDLKVKAVEENNKSLKTVAKLMLNNLYGKFGQDVPETHELPELNEDGVVTWGTVLADIPQDIRVDPFTGETENLGIFNNNKYCPMAAFITSYARAILCDAIRKAGKRFLYCDTDSIHVLNAEKEIDGLEVHPSKLGAWDLESIFFGARYWRPKAYQEYIYYHGTELLENPYWDLKLAGCPAAALKDIDPIEDFKIGSVFRPKLVPKHVKGGVILEDVGFEFKDK